MRFLRGNRRAFTRKPTGKRKLNPEEPLVAHMRTSKELMELLVAEHRNKKETLSDTAMRLLRERAQLHIELRQSREECAQLRNQLMQLQKDSLV